MNHLIRSSIGQSGTAGGRRIILIALVVCLLSLTGCLKNKEKQGDKVNRPIKAMPVTIGLSTVKNVPVALNAIGTVEPFATVAIKSQITGILKKVHFNEGDDVQKGDLLFTLDRAAFYCPAQSGPGDAGRETGRNWKMPERSRNAIVWPPAKDMSPASKRIRRQPKSPP